LRNERNDKSTGKYIHISETKQTIAQNAFIYAKRQETHHKKEKNRNFRAKKDFGSSRGVFV